jgi:hypothetical protein
LPSGKSISIPQTAVPLGCLQNLLLAPACLASRALRNQVNRRDREDLEKYSFLRSLRFRSYENPGWRKHHVSL